MNRVVRPIRLHPFRTLSILALVVLGAGAFLGRDVIRVALTPESLHDLTLPKVTPVKARSGETVYRVDASRSVVKVGVDEILAGKDKRVELTTRVMGGEVATSNAGKSAVRFGEFVVNVGELRSDNALRDKMLRHEFLETHNYPVVRLLDASVKLPKGSSPTAVKGATLTADLEVKDKVHPTEWKVDARVVDDELLVTATTTAKMSDLGVGPINKVGLVRTSDKIDLRVEIIAVDASKFTPPAKLAVELVETKSSDVGPSFKSEIAPILSENCASCHRRGEIGASMWALDYASDAAAVADGLAVVTGAKFMPPWPASDVGVPVKHARGLTDAQIDLISRWAKAGGKLDVAGNTKIVPPKEPDIREPRPDRIVKLSEPYQLDGKLKDEYRCFILDPKITETSYLTGYTFDPDSLKVVHHAIVNRVPAGPMLELAKQKDAADEGPGWTCFTGMGGNSGQRIAGWVPGQRPFIAPEGNGFQLDPGDVLVAQIHYHYDPAAPPDQSGMTLELAKDAKGIVALQSRTLIGPVEVPCPPNSKGPLCDRKASLADVDVRFGPGSSVIADVLHRTCGTTPEQVAAASDGITASTTCDFKVRQSGDIIGMLAHMHEMGSSYRMTLNPDTPAEKVLLDIPTWNFSWQMGYSPVDDVPIEHGDVIRVTCNWDRRTRFDPSPRYVVFAEGTEDEMCFTTLTVRPRPEASP
ncbi:MAG: YceI family protein [Microthrixaceae bacterium]